MQLVRKTAKWAIILSVIAAIAKRRYPKAPLSALLKRLIGFLVARILPVPTPQIVTGNGSIAEIPSLLKKMRCKKPLIVTDKMLIDHGLVKPVMDSLTSESLMYEVYDNVVANPPSELVEEGFEIYKSKDCDSIIAFGGGSPMDVAKVIGAKVANPQDIESYQGFFMVSRLGLSPLPPLIAVPTTAGTGSETTVAAVITIKKDNKKIAIADLGLVPRVAVLDPSLCVKLPQGVTAATGMDALTHAIESFLGGWSSAFTRKNSLSATEKIFQNILTAYKDGANLDAREAMLNASFEAGLAFTRANVGYVHAIAHQFGGMFHTAHGVANAMLLPHVLDFYLQDETPGSGNLFCTRQFTELAQAANMTNGCSPNTLSASEKHKIARQFVDRIAEMNAKMAIAADVKEMKASDVEEVAIRALKEAHGDMHDPLKKPLAAFLDLGYPTPKYMTLDDCKRIIAKVLPVDERQKWMANNPWANTEQ